MSVIYAMGCADHLKIHLLEPGDVRRIPFPGSGYRLRFDTSGTNDTMLAIFLEGALGQERVTAASGMRYAQSRSQPLVRGIAIEAAGKVTEDRASSATSIITFNVHP